jgi:hypothetical protein
LIFTDEHQNCRTIENELTQDFDKNGTIQSISVKKYALDVAMTVEVIF